MARMIVAGFGNVLRGDDGFGVEVVRRLQEQADRLDDTLLLEIGTGGLALVQHLLTPCDRLVIVDAMTRNGEPGTVYVLRVESVDTVSAIDMHMAVPARALELAKALGALPTDVYLVGCEPAVVDELQMTLSTVVDGAVDRAVREVKTLLTANAHV